MFAKTNHLVLSGLLSFKAQLHSVVEDKLSRRIAAASVVCGGLMAAGGVALADGGTVGTGIGCHSTAATSITGFIGDAADFAIYIGAAGALLMLAVGALFIIFGGTPDRVSKGMKIIKNAVIGVAILAVGFFIRYIVVNLVLGATGETKSSCLNSGGGGFTSS